MVTYVDRPISLSGCWGSWDEADQPVIIRSAMEDGIVKVRRRFTGVYRVANVTVALPSSKLAAFMSWFRLDCQQGVVPTTMFDPLGVEGVWRFTQAPQVAYMEPGVKGVRISCIIEQQPGWVITTRDATPQDEDAA
jgi:hypothetical protein